MSFEQARTVAGRVAGPGEDDVRFRRATDDALGEIRQRQGAIGERLRELHQRLGVVGSGGPSTTTDATSTASTIGLTGAVTGEQLAEILGRDSVPSWLPDVLDRFPNLSVESVSAIAATGVSPRLDGLVALVRGYHGEQLAVDALAAGLLPMPPDVDTVSLAGTTNEPGVDLWLDSEAGPIPAQVKIGRDASGIADHFDRWSDVGVVYASSDAAAAAEGLIVVGEVATVVRSGDAWPQLDGPIVVDIGMSSDELSTETLAAFDSVAAGGLIDGLIEDLPLVALGLVAARGGWRWARTEDDTSEIRDDIVRSGKNVVVNAGVGEIAAGLSGMELVKIPATIVTAIGRESAKRTMGSVCTSTQRAVAAQRLLQKIRSTANSVTVTEV